MLHLQAHRGTESLFSPVPGPGTVDSQGQIEFLRCYATLKTKSQTKFYLEFHSSCLESTQSLTFLLVGTGMAPLHKCLFFVYGTLPHFSSLGRTEGWVDLKWGSKKWAASEGPRGHPVMVC